MSRYTSLEQVKIRLRGKVRFTDDVDEEDKMSFALANDLIAEAESDVEQDLSVRYLAPFQSKTSATFGTLPPTTKNYLRTLAQLKAAMRILETDYGSGTAMEGDKYYKSLSDRYDKMVEKIIQVRGDGASGFKYPPLPDLTLNYFNTAADDGYRGMVLVSSLGDGDFPSRQINDPQENFWNAEIDATDRSSECE